MLLKDAMRIGEYIHFYYNNYEDYGLGKDSPKNKLSVSKIYDDQKKKLLDHISNNMGNMKEDTQGKLQDTLNYFFRKGGSVDLKFKDFEMEKIKNTVFNLLEKKIENEWQSIDIETLGTKDDLSQYKNLYGGFLTQEVDSELRKCIVSFKKLKSPKQDSSLTAQSSKAIEKRLRVLNDLSHKITNDDFQNQLKELNKQWKNLSGVRGSSQSYTNFIDDLNNFIQEVKGNAVSKELGAVVEHAIALAGGALKALCTRGVEDSVAIINEAVGNAIVGNQRSAAAQQTNKFIVNSGSKVSGFTFQAEDRYYPTQEKVDVSMYFQDQTPFNISAKNTNLVTGGAIHLQSGRGILNLIENYPMFVNHYLNIVPPRYRGEEPQPKADGQNIQTMHEAMILTIGLTSLIGGTFRKMKDQGFRNSTMANYLVINDSSKGGGFKVFSMLDLANKISKDVNKLLRVQGLTSTSFKNSWYGDNKKYRKNAYSRIIILLSQMRQQKISVTLNKSALK